MTLTEFQEKFTIEEQGTYIGAAIDVVTFVYASKGRAGFKRYYGKPGAETPGPRAVHQEIAIASGIAPVQVS